ncbi:MAG TPA: histidine kinase, partial [Bryobacteraceae bacterium]|nr:histidine kinase [Bryobacteraceae bacterium]
MFQELRFQLSTALLTVLTIAAAVAAGLNYQQIQVFRPPDDGIVWRDRGGQVIATRVVPHRAGDLAGIREGDALESIQANPVHTAEDVAKFLASSGAWSQESYVFRRGGVEVKTTVYVREVSRGVELSYQYLAGVCYLAIGLFIYFRRGSAYKALHFYVFCLVSFIFCSFHATGKLNPFDQVVDYCNFVAGWLAPVLFLHFAMTFPETRVWYRKWMAIAAYVPGVILTLVYAGFANGLLISPGNSLPDDL